MGVTHNVCNGTRPDLHIPDSSSTVDVRIIDTGSLYLRSLTFWQPAIPGFDGLDVPVFSFLISHGDRHVILDLGTRRDWENLPPRTVAAIRELTEDKAEWIKTGPDDVAAILDADRSGLGVRSSDIEAVIWTHNHFDHTGDPSRFPTSTELVVGPGTKAVSWPGFPSKPNATVLDSDIAGRAVREIDFETTKLRIGRFEAFDFFGDGSLYLLNAPGHAVGHMCALARTTIQPASFVLLGGDCCHHPGILRPTKYLPFPGTCPASLIQNGGACSEEKLQELGKWKNPHEPFLTTCGKWFHDVPKSMETVGKVQDLDAADNIWVVLAHDTSLRGKVRMFPDKINSWMTEGISDDTRWLFCEEFGERRC